MVYFLYVSVLRSQSSRGEKITPQVSLWGVVG